MDDLDDLVTQACHLIRLGSTASAHSLVREVVVKAERISGGGARELAYRCYSWLHQIARSFEDAGVTTDPAVATFEAVDFPATAKVSTLAVRFARRTDSLFDDTTVLKRTAPPSFKRARDYIQMNHHLPMRVKEVAEAVGCTPRHLRRIFAEANEGPKTTPGDLIRRCRVVHGQVPARYAPCFAAGGGRPQVWLRRRSQALRRTFSREIGMPPSEYRRIESAHCERQ